MALVGSDVTASRLVRIGPRHSALVGCQEADEPIPTAASVAGVDCAATGAKRHRPRWAAVVPQWPEPRIDTIQIAGAIEIARLVAAQVETLRLERSAAAILRTVACDDSILHVDRQAELVVNGPAWGLSESGAVSADGGIVDLRTSGEPNELPVVYRTSDPL